MAALYKNPPNTPGCCDLEQTKLTTRYFVTFNPAKPQLKLNVTFICQGRGLDDEEDDDDDELNKYAV